MSTRSNGSTKSSRMRSQPPPAASTGPASKPKVGCSGSVPSCFSDARAWACRSSSPHDPGKSRIAFRSPSSAPAISKNDPGPSLGLVPGGGGGGSFLGASAAMNPIPSLFFMRGETPQRDGCAQLVDGEAAAGDQRAQLDLRVEVRDVEDDRPLRVDDLKPVDRDRRRFVGDDVDQRAQPPGDAADVQLPFLLGERRFDQLPEPRPLQDDGGGEHHDDNRPHQAEDR